MANEADQARHCVDQILENREAGIQLTQQAVLFRNSSHSGLLEIELSRRNVPFKKFGGLKFLDSVHVKDLLAILRFGQNPRDRVAGFRVLQLCYGIGRTAAQRVLEAIEPLSDPLQGLTAMPTPPRAGEDWHSLVKMLAELATADWPDGMGSAKSWYDMQLDRVHEDADHRRADLLQLEQIAGGYPSRERFLTELTLDPPDATSGQAGVPVMDDDYLFLSTIHSAKGQEWKAVFILNVVDGCIPARLATGTSAEIEEERRLLYVAKTRAKDTLTLGVPTQFYATQQAHNGDRHLRNLPSRFLPNEMLDLFEVSHWSPASPTGQTRPRAHPALDVSAKLRSRWE